jgi:hypothetical protein
MPLGGTKDVVVSPPLASPITVRNAITIVPEKLAITAVAKQQHGGCRKRPSVAFGL